MGYILLILLMLMLSAFFSGMEIAFVASNKLRIELDRKQSNRSARAVTVFTRNPEQYLATMLVGNNIALVIYGLVMAIMLEPVIGRFVRSEITILIIQTVLSTLLILVTAEFLPKAIFRINPNAFLNLLSIPVMFFYVLLFPVTSFIIWISNFILKNFLKTDIRTISRINVFGKIDLDHLVNEAQMVNGQEHDNEAEIKIFQNALDFSNVKLRDCMIPRTEIEAIDITTSIPVLQEKFVETGYSKILVYEDTIDNMVGYISSKDLFKNPQSINTILVKPLIVPETMAANRLLKRLMQEHKSLAVVVDEFGGTSGLITIEDVLEEIFGEIEDEHDTQDLIEKKVGEYEYIFSGRLEIEYLNEKYALHIPESSDYETLAGFILHVHQSIPKPNERIVSDPFVLRILKVTNTKVELVQLSSKNER
jgi:CBS domain containing-hemolysin-like protein